MLAIAPYSIHPLPVPVVPELEPPLDFDPILLRQVTHFLITQPLSLALIQLIPVPQSATQKLFHPLLAAQLLGLPAALAFLRQPLVNFPIRHFPLAPGPSHFIQVLAHFLFVIFLKYLWSLRLFLRLRQIIQQFLAPDGLLLPI